MSEPSRTIPLRELRNNVSKVLKDVDDGETIRVTVDGRPVADLVPVSGRRIGVPFSELLRILRETPVDPGWATDIADMDEEMPDEDPWEPRR